MITITCKYEERDVQILMIYSMLHLQ